MTKIEKHGLNSFACNFKKNSGENVWCPGRYYIYFENFTIMKIKSILKQNVYQLLRHLN